MHAIFDIDYNIVNGIFCKTGTFLISVATQVKRTTFLDVLLDYAMGFLTVVVEHLQVSAEHIMCQAVHLDYSVMFPNVVVGHFLAFPTTCMLLA